MVNGFKGQGKKREQQVCTCSVTRPLKQGYVYLILTSIRYTYPPTLPTWLCVSLSLDYGSCLKNIISECIAFAS